MYARMNPGVARTLKVVIIAALSGWPAVALLPEPKTVERGRAPTGGTPPPAAGGGDSPDGKARSP